VEPNIETFNALIRVSAAAKDMTNAQRWLEEAVQMVRVLNIGTFHAMLRAIRQSGEDSSVEVWVEKLMNMGLQPDVECCNLIIGIYADKQMTVKAEEWLAITEHNLGITPNVGTFNAAISAHTGAGDIQLAERLVQVMQNRGLEPDAETYMLLIGDGRSYRRPKVVKRWANRMKEHCKDVTVAAYTSVIGAWAAVGNADQAEEWFSKMMQEGKQTAEALALVVDTLVLSNQVNGQLTAQDWVQECQGAGTPLSPAVYAALASQDVYDGDFEQVEARMQQMEAEGFRMNEDSLIALLLAYANARPQQPRLAEQMFKQQMLGGNIRATREMFEALRAAVGGARCLALRRELKLSSTSDVENFGNPLHIPTGRKAGMESFLPKKGPPNRQWAVLAPPAPKSPVLTWE